MIPHGPQAVARLLRPKSVAIVGMSSRPGTTGKIALKSLEVNNFAGDIHLVGRNAEPIEGRPVLKSAEELPLGVDLAVLTLPAAGVREAIEACAKREVGAALVFASGFAEAGGRDEQEAIARIARDAGLAIVGPNCIGFTNNVDGLEFHLLFARVAKRYTPGDPPGVAFIGQSGGLLGHMQRATEARGVPLSYMVSTGNEAGLDATDFVQYLCEDPATSVIAIYAEQILRPREFMEACRNARAAGKPVVMLHPGHSKGAKAAAQSHTGALAGDYAAMLVHVERAGALVVKTVDELTDTAEILVRFPKPPERGPAILTASGALVAVFNDYAEDLGFEIPRLEAYTLQKLNDLLPAFGTYGNPLDVTTAYKDENLPLITRALLDDPNVGMLFIGSAMGLPVRKMNEGMAGATKPLVLAMLGDGSPLPPPIADAVKESPAVLSRSVDRSMRAIANLVRYGRASARLAEGPAPQPFANLPQVGSGAQPEWLGKRILAAAGIRIPPGDLARSLPEAIAVARRVGFPVALKAQAAALTHKTEAGGVALNIADEKTLRNTWETMMQSVARYAPAVTLDGALVEAMSKRGIELMVGAKRDPAWGTILLVGLGGIWVEALGDVQLLAVDADQRDVAEALRRLRSAKLLDGFRGAPPADADAVVETVLAIGRLMRTNHDIVEIDVNPLMVHPRGQGVTALDALIVAG